MAIHNSRSLLEQQILSNSGLKGKSLEDLKSKLAQMTEQQLQAELSKSLSGDSKENWYTGVMLEHNESIVSLDNYDQTTITDENGNEITTYKDGDLILERKTKDKSGKIIETTTYKYNYDAQIPLVTIQTTKSDNTKIMIDVLEVDENGNYAQEDFIESETIAPNGEKTQVYFSKEKNIVEKVEKPNGITIATVYNGDNIEDFNNKKLYRKYQRIEQNGETYEVEYDGKGNTLTTANAGDTLPKIAQRFKVSATEVETLNKSIRNLKVLQRVVVPGEHDANSNGVKNTQDPNTALNIANRAEYNRQVAKKVTEGTDQKIANELSNNGFKPTAENYIFYQRFKALNPAQQQNVLSVIKYCRSQKITDPNKIKARILETFPEINLFDSGKVIQFNSPNTPSFQRKNPISLETFLTENLKLDLNSQIGKTVYERLASLPQEELNKINPRNFVDLSKSTFVDIAQRFESNGVNIRTKQEHQIENNTPRMKAEQEKRELRDAASQNIALAYDNAINIIKQYQGNQGWINVGYWREKLGKQIDIKGVNTCFEQVIEQLEKEKRFAVGYLKGKSANEKDFNEAFRKVTGGAEYNEANMKAFLAVAQDPKADFNDEKYNQKFWNAYNKAFGVAKKDSNGKVTYEPKIVEDAVARTNYQQYVDGAGDIVLMLLGTEALGKGITWAGAKVAGSKFAAKLTPYIPKFISKVVSKVVTTVGSNEITVGKVATNMAQQSATFTIWDASKNYINLKTKDIQYFGEAAEKEWEAYIEGNIESAKFGAAAGLLNTTVVGKVVNGTMRMFEKPIAKAVSKVGKSFEKTPAMTGSDVMKTFMLNQTPGMLAQTAGTIAEIGGFTLYETANESIKEILKTDENGEHHLPKEMTEEGLTSYLWDKLKGQAANLGEIKAISRLIFMHKGAIEEQSRLMDENLAKCETLKNVKIKKAEVNGREIFEVTMPDGNRKVANSIEEVIANCNILMQLDMISNSVKENSQQNYPSLSEIDKYARDENINQANMSYRRFSSVNGREAQQQVSDYLNKLLETVPDDVPEVEIDDVKMYADFILPDGTVISRNHAGDTGEIYRNPRTGMLDVKSVDNAVLFWIRDIDGKEHVLPALSKSNLAKAKKLLGYMSTLQEVPRMQIVEAQAKILEAKKQADDNKTTPQGMNAEENALIQKARTENPATVVEEKVHRQWQQHDIETPASDEKVDLFNLDPNAGLKEPVTDVQNEVTSLIFKGKLNETLTQRYDEMGKVFIEIVQKRSADIKELVKANPKDKQAVANGIVKILAQELGMEGFEPPIVFVDTKVVKPDGTVEKNDGYADWPNGRIVVNEDIKNVKTLTSILSHEFVHILQYRDILAQYGEQGLRDLIANDKSIPEDKKEQYIQNTLNNEYNQHLLQSYDFQKAQTGTVNDYLRRIYKDEFTNTVGTDNMPEYVNQASERGAYSSQEKVDRALDYGIEELNIGEIGLSQAETVQQRLAKMRQKLGREKVDLSEDNPQNRTVEPAEEVEIDNFGQIHRKEVPAGVANDENKTTNANQQLLNETFDEKAFEQRKQDLLDKVLSSNTLLNDRIKTIINKIKPENIDAAEKVYEYSISEAGKKLFADDGASPYEIMGVIEKEHLEQFHDMAAYFESIPDLSNSTKRHLLYNIAKGIYKPETVKSLLSELNSSDISNLDESSSFLYFGAEGKQLEAMLEFYKEAKTGKYDKIINKDKILYYMSVVNENNAQATKRLLNAFAEESLPDKWLENVLVGVLDPNMAKDTEVDAIIDLYNASKNYLGEGTLPGPDIFRRLKSEDVAFKIEILNMIKDSGFQQYFIDEVIRETNKDNIDIAKEFAQKAFINKEIPANNIWLLLSRFGSKTRPLDINFVRENIDFIASVEPDILRYLTPENINLAKVISENKSVPYGRIKDLLNHATDKASEAKLIGMIGDGMYERPEVEVMAELKEEYVKIIQKFMPSEQIKELKEFYEDDIEGLNKALIESAIHKLASKTDIKLTDEENAVISKILNIKTVKNFFDLSDGAGDIVKAGYALNMYSENRNKAIYNLNYAIENSRLPAGSKINPKEVIEQFNKELYPLLTPHEINIVKSIFINAPSESLPPEKRFSVDFYKQLKKRAIMSILEDECHLAYNMEINNYIMELLNCSDEEFAVKREKLNKRAELRTGLSIDVPNFKEWKRLLNMSDSEYEVLKVPFEQRTEAPVDIEAYKTEVTARINEPVTYNPIEAARVIARAQENQNIRQSGDYKPSKINPFEKLPPKEKVDVEPLQSATSLMSELYQNKHVVMSIPNEGGVKVKPYDAVIHPKDEARLGVEEEAGMNIHYGKKLQWSNFKIARDILQNYYDGHGHTLEGVNVEVTEINGKYKIKVSGESTWDYTHLDEVGSSTKEGDFYDAGGFGEGTRAVAVSLLSKLGTENVKYSSGDWTMTYRRSSDDLSNAYMTQTLTRNDSKVKGSTVEFETDNADLVNKLFEAKDYFNHPHNPDFKNFDYENDFFGIKFQPKGQGGNVYLIQRYESNGLHNGGVDGATIVFKTKPDHPTLVEKDGADFKLGTGADRAQIPVHDINRILSRYVKTMTDEELTQMISSMENMWRIDLAENGEGKISNNELFKPFVQEAKNRDLGIDFSSDYVYIAKDEPVGHIEMAKIMGFKLATEDMKNLGMQSYVSVDTSKMPHQPTEVQSKQIRLLDEGVRILQECTDFDTKDLINSEELEKPTYMFSDGGLLGSGAEAIIEDGKYEGHWMRDSHLYMQDYVGNLATFLHEISHKTGGDTSEEFSEQLIKFQTHIVKVLTKNPNALAKFQTLAKMYHDVRKSEIKDLKDPVTMQSDFTPEKYRAEIQEQLDRPQEYKEYVEEYKEKSFEEYAYGASDELKKAGIMLDVENAGYYTIINGRRVELSAEDVQKELSELYGTKSALKSLKKTFKENFSKTKNFAVGSIKKYAKSFINKLRSLRNKSEDNYDDMMDDGGIILSSSKASASRKRVEKYNYIEYTKPEPVEFTTLPTGDAMMEHLNGTGHVEISIPNSGGLAPKISELPLVESDPNFNKTVLAKMKIKYAQKRDWSNEKVARDIMQNFYDGNGHTLEGVKISANKGADGTYTIRIDGNGIYNYIYLNRLGGSDKFDPKDAGGFGEGSRVVAASLLAKGTERVRFSCKDWQVDFTSSEPENINEASMLRTLTKPDKIVEGNYIEFDTKDENLVREIMESKNYFYNPHNPDFKNLDFENEFFGFKVTPNQNGNIYYIQRYQTPDKKMEGGLQDMTLTFKQAAFGKEFEERVGYKIDLNTTRDRMALEAPQILDLGRAYAKTLTNDELSKALSVLEPILTSSTSEDMKFKITNEEKNNLSYIFACAIRQEAISRGMKFDFGGKKIVAVDRMGEYQLNLDVEEEQFFIKQGYIFCDSQACPLGIEKAHDIYERLHRPHSVKPTQGEAKKLQIINEAIKIIVQQDEMGLFPDLSGKGLYVFDKSSNIKNNVTFHAVVKDNNYDGLFINREKLGNTGFINMVTEALAEIMEIHGKKSTANYSYNLTDLISSELNAFISNPETAEKFRVLEEMYNNAQ